MIRYRSSRYQVLGLGAMLVLFAACSPPAEDIVDTSEVLYFERIGMGQQGEGREAVEAVVRTQEEWDALRSTVQPLEDFKPVDFDQQMVAIVGVPTESGGYTLEVESIVVDRDTVTVSYVVHTPKDDCISPIFEALPFQAVAVRKADGVAVFERRVQRYSCAF